jgi:hypothetical protein
MSPCHLYRVPISVERENCLFRQREKLQKSICEGGGVSYRDFCRFLSSHLGSSTFLCLLPRQSFRSLSTLQSFLLNNSIIHLHQDPTSVLYLFALLIASVFITSIIFIGLDSIMMKKMTGYWSKASGRAVANHLLSVANCLLS